MKIQLVQTKLGINRMRNGRDMMVVPLGLASIATYVKRHNPKAEIGLIDGDFEENLPARLNGEIICISPNILNMDNELMQTLHQRGQTVILGGVHASQAWAELVKLPFVDYVARGDGEQTILEVSLGKDLNSIDGLASENKEGVFQSLPIDQLPTIDRTLFNQERYMQNSAKFIETYFPSRPFRRIASIYSSKGCGWRKNTGGCYFCGRMYKNLEIRSPEKVWSEVSMLVNKYKADFIWDVSDSFTCNEGWMKKMVEKKPKSINPYWYVYARISELNEEMLKDLKSIGVYQVLVGVETGDDSISKEIGKGNRNNRTLKIAKLTKKHGIKLLPSFIVGLPGESEESLEKTYELAKEVVEINGSEELSVSMMIPLPGSRAYDDLKKMHKNLTGENLPILTEGEDLQRLWFNYKCKTSFETGIKYMLKLLGLTPLKSTFGTPMLDINPNKPGWNQLNGEARHKLLA